MWIIKNVKAVKKNELYEKGVEVRGFAHNLFCTLRWKSTMQNVVMMWCESKTHIQQNVKEERRPKRFLHAQPVQYCSDSVLFISTSGHFFLIRHLPASGLFIIYRKLITYTRLQPRHLLQWLLLQKQLHTMGPWARVWDYWFSPELTDLIAAKCTRICQPFSRHFPPRLVSTHLSCQTCIQWMLPNCLTTKEQLYVVHLIDSITED